MKSAQQGKGEEPHGRRSFDAVWAVTAAFGAYFCMYAFRKPFTAATAADYGELVFANVDYKTLLVVAQVLGYLLSKFLGIKIVAEMPPRRRAAGVVALILVAEASLLGMGALPPPWNIPCLFLNGLSLGLVFGLVLGFLEGRQVSEALIAGLCASFILADGAMKTVGAAILEAGVSAFWMPAAAGALFLAPTALFAWMLSRVRPPSERDVAYRSPRPPMTGAERLAFVRRFGVGLTLIVVAYVFTTVMRAVRADFAPEIWAGLGYDAAPGLFTRSELGVAFGVVAINGATSLIADNRRAFFASLGISVGGFLAILATVGLFAGGVIHGFAFMVLIGLGLYLPYVAVHTTVFERLIAMTRARGNVGFLMYVADAFGYSGFVLTMLAEQTPLLKGRPADTFVALCIGASALSLLCLGGSVWYFRTKTQAYELEPATTGSAT